MALSDVALVQRATQVTAKHADHRQLVSISRVSLELNAMTTRKLVTDAVHVRLAFLVMVSLVDLTSVARTILVLLVRRVSKLPNHQAIDVQAVREARSVMAPIVKILMNAS